MGLRIVHNNIRAIWSYQNRSWNGSLRCFTGSVVMQDLWLREVRKSPQLFVCSFDRNVAKLFSDPSLRQCLHHPVKNKQKRVLIYYNNARVTRLWAFNFTKIPDRHILFVPRYYDLKRCAEKGTVTTAKNKNMCYYMDSNPRPLTCTLDRDSTT